MIDLFVVDGVAHGAIAIALRPRGGDWLVDELGGLARAGYGVLVSMLQDDEIAELELDDEARAATAAGLVFVRHPVADRGVPDVDSTIRIARDLAKRIDAGAHIAVHCRQGIGRSAVLVTTVLVVAGRSADEAWQLVTEARGRAVPDTAAQRAWLFDVEHRLSLLR